MKARRYYFVHKIQTENNIKTDFIEVLLDRVNLFWLSTRLNGELLCILQ
jgi:hypothetical protein